MRDSEDNARGIYPDGIIFDVNRYGDGLLNSLGLTKGINKPSIYLLLILYICKKYRNMFAVIERNDYTAVVIKATNDYLYVASPGLTKVSRKSQQDGALAWLTQKTLSKLSGRGFARVKVGQDYEEVEEFDTIDEAIVFINGNTEVIENNNPIVTARIAKFMTKETVNTMAELDEELNNTEGLLGTVAAFATTLKQKTTILRNELNNRATAKDVKQLKLSLGKISGVLQALASNKNTAALLAVGEAISESTEDFDANEFLGLEATPVKATTQVVKAAPTKTKTKKKATR